MPEHLEFLQGRRIISFSEAKYRAEVLLGDRLPEPIRQPLWKRVWQGIRRIFGWPLPEPVPPRLQPRPRIHYGGVPVPESEVTGHFLIVGSPGSGKTLLLLTTIIEVLRQLIRGSDRRALVYDAKREWFGLFQSLGLKVPIHYLNPFDPRGWAWDIGKDITNRAEAMQAAAAFVPRTREDTDKFWINSTRNILGAVIYTLAEMTAGNFTLRDVLLTMRSRERLAFILGSRPDTAHLWSEATADEKTMANLMATFHSHLQKFEVVAALWENTPRKFSIREWASSESVLLIAGHPVYREALTPIHQVLINLAADRLLNVPDTDTRRSWLFLDEFRNLGRISKIYHLANEGRSKGVVLVLGFQS